MADQDLTQNPVRELVRRFLITFLVGVVIYRFGTFVPIPGVDAKVLSSTVHSGGNGSDDPLGAILRYADMFNGQALSNASIFGLGLMPYISASIIMQLLTFSIPALKQLQKDGEGGRRKINQYTRYATLLICTVQSLMASLLMASYIKEGKSLVNMDNHMLFVAQSVVVITTGSMLLLWLAEQITKFGIGNGVSVMIMIGILSSIPAAFAGGDDADLPHYLLVIVVSLLIIAAIVIVVQATRRINLEQQRRVQGNKIYGGATTSLPLKLNQANVIPVIFASPVMVVLGVFATKVLGIPELISYGGVGYRYIFAALIIGFTFFYISITFDLNEMSNHFKQQGFFVRGIKPGKKTVDFLAYHLKRITFVGAIFLAVIAIMPQILDEQIGLAGNRGGRALMGGTGLLIVVGVALDIMQKVASYFLAHQFRGSMGEGFGAQQPKKSGKRF